MQTALINYTMMQIRSYKFSSQPNTGDVRLIPNTGLTAREGGLLGVYLNDQWVQSMWMGSGKMKETLHAGSSDTRESESLNWLRQCEKIRVSAYDV